MDFYSMHNQKAVYWPPGPLGKDGKETYLEARQIRCRWEDEQIEVKDPTRSNGVWMSKAQCFTTEKLEKNGYLWEGEYSRLTDVANPKKNLDAARIELRTKIPSIDTTEFEYIAYM